MKFRFDSAKIVRPSSHSLIDLATSSSSPIFSTHPHGYNFFVKFYPFGIRPATGYCASILFAPFPGNYDNLLQWPFSKLIHFVIRDQLDPPNTWTKTIWPNQDLTYKKPTNQQKQLRQSSSVILFVTLISFYRNWRFSDCWFKFYRDQISWTSYAKTSNPNLSPLAFSIEPLNHFHLPLSGVNYRVTHNAWTLFNWNLIIQFKLFFWVMIIWVW